MQSASVELITTMHGDSQTSRQRRMCSMIGSGFVTSKECKCWSTISSVSTTPNRWPERKVGDRGETRLADISPCMFMGKKTRGGKILCTREEHGDDVDGGRQVLSAVGEELPGVSLIYISICRSIIGFVYSPRGPRGEILYTGIRSPSGRGRAGERGRGAVGATCRRKIEG